MPFLSSLLIPTIIFIIFNGHSFKGEGGQRSEARRRKREGRGNCIKQMTIDY
jgi:hypothetical protein